MKQYSLFKGLLATALIAIFAEPFATAYATAPTHTVAVSNYPLYLLSQAVTKGNYDAQLLLSAGDVGHHGDLSPAKIKLAKDSQFVVWFGNALEQNLVNTLDGAPNAIKLFDFSAFEKKPMRDLDGAPIAGSFDPHIWLAPRNARAIVGALAEIHSHAHPENRAIYTQNAQEFYQQLGELTERYGKKMGEKSHPYWAYHDSFQYLEPVLSLQLAGTLSPDHHLPPKASRFMTLDRSRPQKTMCLAAQNTVSDGIKSHLAPIHIVQKQEDMSDKDSYLAAWEDLAQGFASCVDAG